MYIADDYRSAGSGFITRVCFEWLISSNKTLIYWSSWGMPTTSIESSL